MLSFAFILRVNSQVVRMLEVVFPKSLIGATIQDGGKRERRNNSIDSRSSIMKSILIVFHFISETSSKYSSSNSKYQMSLVCKQRSQVLTYWLIYLNIQDHQ